MPSSNSPIDKIISIQSFESDGKLKLLRGYIGGGFQVNDDFISGSILLAPRDVQQFPVSDASQLTLELLASHIDIIEPDLFLIGVGGNPTHLYQQFRDYFKKRAIGLDIMSTASACRTWNVLQSEGRKVAACLIAII
ncbi:Mth938-like domain-containing protein [Alphaproteobacteria bacterium]|nr:Mth938-like domain-containing protein [Alphaproteobacteria bacterium]